MWGQHQVSLFQPHYVLLSWGKMHPCKECAWFTLQPLLLVSSSSSILLALLCSNVWFRKAKQAAGSRAVRSLLSTPGCPGRGWGCRVGWVGLTGAPQEMCLCLPKSLVLLLFLRGDVRGRTASTFTRRRT